MKHTGIPESLLRGGVPATPRRSGEAARSAGDGAPSRQGAAARAKTRRVALATRIKSWGENHLQALFNILGRMARSPLSTFMTVAVIGIALALPTGLHVALQSALAVSEGWEDTAQISLFMRTDLDADALRRLATEIGAMDQVATVIPVSPSQALEEFQRLSGFGEVLEALDDNPLPPLLIVRPDLQFAAPAEVEALLHRLARLPEVDTAQLDMEWVKRLYAIMEIGKRGVQVLGILLALAVLLIIGNTIRLAIQNRREEIVIEKLIGATNAFIRRPFLYSGFLHGLFGAVFAWLLVSISLLLLHGPVQRLSLLYGSDFEVGGVGWTATGLLLLGGMGLGLTGAWLAVGRHLREIEPS